MASSWVGFSRGTAEPFIYFDSLPPLSAFPARSFSGGPLGPGGVWIRSQELASTAPVNSFIGVSIDRGNIRPSTAVSVGTGSTLDIAERDLTVDLTIRPAAQSTSTFSSLTVPTTVEFKFTSTGRGRLELSQSVQFSVFGTSMELNYLTQSQAQYDERSKRVNIPFAIASSISTFQVQEGSTKLVDFVSASIPVTNTFWSFQESTALTSSSLIVGAGSALISLGAGLRVVPKILGARSLPMMCGPSYLLVEPHRMLSRSIEPTTSFGKYRLKLPRRGAIVADGSAGHAEYAFENQNGTETWAMKMSSTAFLDRPQMANGDRLIMSGIGDISVTKDASSDPPSLHFRQVHDSGVGNGMLTFALKNLLVKSKLPASLELDGLLNDGSVQSGSFIFRGDLVFTMPFLPDPYATNAVLPVRDVEATAVGKVAVQCGWTSDEDFQVNVDLPNGAMSRVKWIAAGPNSYAADKDGQNLLKEEEDQLDGAVGGKVDGPTFLDLSSNASQLGVTFDVSSFESNIKVNDLLLQAPVRVQNVLTLPTVEWEPVLTAAKDQNRLQPFPTPFDFPNSGPPGRVGANSVDLVPISPEGAMNGVLSAYNAVPSARVVAEFSLPFGIVAFAKLSRSNILTPLFPSPSLSNIRPRFDQLGLQGAAQLSIRAAGRSLIADVHPRAPSIPGAALMLKFRPSVLEVGDPSLSILGAVGTVRDFNDDFGPTASAAAGRHGPLVPATRADVSGYGLSMFSEWQDPLPVLPANEKVDIEVILGRAEKQVIQQTYRCLPHGAKFTRIVTMQRQNNGAIYRTSILKCASDGIYQFDDPDIITHPGLVRAYTNIRNVRDAAGGVVTLTDGTTLSPVLYDADVLIQVDVTEAAITTIAIDHRGYIITGDGHATADPSSSTVPIPFGPAQYQEFLTKHGGELGGLLDCQTALSGLKINVMNTAIDFSLRVNRPEFVVGVGTMAEFRGLGVWSFLRLGDSEDAQYVDRSGVPLIREGASTVTPTPTTPFRFAHPSDLLTRRSGVDFCILHTTHSQRVLFPQPKIEADGLSRITSLKVPFIADPFALAYSVGPFPKLQTCIPFENSTASPANYYLQIDPQGDLRLQLPQAKFQTPISQRIFQDSDSAGVIVDTTSDANGSSEITLMVDSASSPAWDFKITKVGLVNQSGNRGSRVEITRLSGDVVCSPSTVPKLLGPRFAVGGPLGPVFEVLAFLQNMGKQPDMKMSMTNDWSLYVGAEFGIEALAKLNEGLADALEEIFDTLNFTIESNIRTLAQTTTLAVQVIFWIPSPWPPIKFLVNAQFRLVFATTNNVGLVRIPPPPIPTNTGLVPPAAQGGYTVELGLGAGIGIKFSVLTLKAVGSCLLTQSVIFNTDSGNWGIGTSLLLKADVDIIPGFLSAGISIETKMMLLFVNCIRDQVPAPKTIWGVAQVTIGIHVDLFLIVNIEFEVQAEWSTRFNDGPCELEEFSAIGL